MSYQEQHEMQLVKTHPSGSQEWFCPICGRRFVMQFQFEYEKLNMQVLEAGNEMASHFGGQGGLNAGKVGVNITESEDPIISPELREALDEALKGLDFGD